MRFRQIASHPWKKKVFFRNTTTSLVIIWKSSSFLTLLYQYSYLLIYYCKYLLSTKLKTIFSFFFGIICAVRSVITNHFCEREVMIMFATYNYIFLKYNIYNTDTHTTQRVNISNQKWLFILIISKIRSTQDEIWFNTFI